MHRLKPYLHKRNSEQQIIQAVSSVYHDMATLFIPHLPGLFQVLADHASYPLLFHCRGGKDRTGVVLAMIHKLLGVSDDVLVKDYLLTNEYLLPRAKKMVRRINLFAFGMLPLRNYEIAYAASEAYLNSFLDAILKRHGSIQNYILSNGVKEEEIDSMKEILLFKQGR
jgi:protein-tyrosine phosphatase